jgi:hypothetical protein
MPTGARLQLDFADLSVHIGAESSIFRLESIDRQGRAGQAKVKITGGSQRHYATRDGPKGCRHGRCLKYWEHHPHKIAVPAEWPLFEREVK